MAKVKTKIFKSNRSQAVRFPNEVAMPESVKIVEIIKIGKKRIIMPAGQTWDEWFDSQGVSEDFMIQRYQPDDQTRESL